MGGQGEGAVVQTEVTALAKAREEAGEGVVGLKELDRALTGTQTARGHGGS